MRNLCLILLLLSVFVKAQSVKDLRILLKKASENTNYANELVMTANRRFKVDRKPLLLAFEGAGYLFKAKWDGNVILKLNYFKKGKNLIDSAVYKDSTNVEIRLIRYMAQANSPKILGYHDNLLADRNFILQHYMETDDADLVSYIKHIFKK